MAAPDALLPPVALPPVLLLPIGVPLSLPEVLPEVPDVPDVPDVPEVPAGLSGLIELLDVVPPVPPMPVVPLVPLLLPDMPEVPEVPEVPLFSPDFSLPAPGVAPGDVPGAAPGVVLPVPEVPPAPGAGGVDSDGGGVVAGEDELGVVELVPPLVPVVPFSSPPPPPRLQAATLIVSRPRHIRVFVICSFGFITIPFN